MRRGIPQGSYWTLAPALINQMFGDIPPLSAAAEEGKLEVVKILCRKRANVSLDSQQDPVSATFFLLDKNPIEFTNSGDLEAFASMDDV